MVEQLAGGILVDWFSNVLGWLMLALLAFKVFVFIDAAFRREDAYRAVDKQTKPFWLIVLGLAVAVSIFSVPGLGQMLSGRSSRSDLGHRLLFLAAARHCS